MSNIESATSSGKLASTLVGLALGITGAIFGFNVKVINEHAERIAVLEVKLESIERSVKEVDTKVTAILVKLP